MNLDKFNSLNHRIWPHCLSVLLLILISVITFYHAISIHPFDSDNLIALSLASKPNPVTYFTGSLATYLPAYRPVAYLTLWIQYKLSNLNIPGYFLVNVSLWFLCVLIFYVVVYNRTKSWIGAIIASLILLLDGRQLSSFFWIGERQSSLAVFFGIFALFLSIYKSRSSTIQKIIHSFVFLLLLSSSLSKEYGLSFSGAVIVLSFSRRDNKWKELAGVGILSIISYFAMRFLLSSFSTSSFNCEVMGFFSEVRHVCYKEMDITSRISQYIYNILATLLGTLFAGIIDSQGVLVFPAIKTTVRCGFLFFLAFIAFVKEPRKLTPFLSLIIFNAILSFLLFRTRNHLVGLVGFYFYVGVGIQIIFSAIGQVRYKNISIFIVVFTFTAMLFVSFLGIRKQINNRKGFVKDLDPCVDYRFYKRDIDIDLVSRIKVQYGLDNPNCNL